MGKCKSLVLLKSFLWYEPQPSGASILYFHILSFLRAHQLMLQGCNHWWPWHPCLLVWQEVFHFLIFSFLTMKMMANPQKRTWGWVGAVLNFEGSARKWPLTWDMNYKTNSDFLRSGYELCYRDPGHELQWSLLVSDVLFLFYMQLPAGE